MLEGIRHLLILLNPSVKPLLVQIKLLVVMVDQTLLGLMIMWCRKLKTVAAQNRPTFACLCASSFTVCKETPCVTVYVAYSLLSGSCMLHQSILHAMRYIPYS